MGSILSNLPNVSSVTSWEELRKWTAVAINLIAQQVSILTGDVTTNGNDITQAISTVASGMVIMHAGNTAPSGWLLCDGSAVSRKSYASLFLVIQTTYGIGDGMTTFNLPNTQGVFVRGAGSQVISGTTYTGTRGTSQLDAYPSHSHTVNINDTGVANTGLNSTNFINNSTAAGTVIGRTTTNVTNAALLNTAGSGTETRPANIALNYMIKT